MEETRDVGGPLEAGPSNDAWWPTNFMEKLQSVALFSLEEKLNSKKLRSDHEVEGLASYRASQTLWATGKLAEPIPNGFYSIVAERRLKELFDIIPSFDDLYALRSEGLSADVILVDDKDKKLSMLKQLTVTLVKGLSSNPAAVIKKIAGLVYDFYKRSNLDASPMKIASEEVCPALDNQVVQMLGQIRHGTCHARAILFKVLADFVGLESRLVVITTQHPELEKILAPYRSASEARNVFHFHAQGLPKDGVMERIDSDKHISVTVMMNSVELLVDLVHSPGQLMPCSTKAIIMSHISPLGDSDSADYDSCDSPLEPNSPLRAFAERHAEGAENNDSLQSLYQCKLEASANASGPSLQNIMLQSKTMVVGKLNSSHSEPNIANAFWRRSQKKVIAEKSTASSSPEHPLHRLHGKSILSGHRDSYREYRKDMAASRSAGASPSCTRRRRRHSVCITPAIGDDIVRAVRAINEALKQNRFPREQVDALGHRNKKSDPHESVSNFHPDDHDETPGERSIALYFHREQISPQKAFSLPSSPKQSRRQASGICHEAESVASAEMTSTWSNVLGSSKNLNKLLLPFQEWYIDFSELTVGTRVGIGFFGEVFRGIWNGIDVAIKVFLVQDLTVENVEDFCNEISILSRLRHPNVILFLGACTKPPRLSVVTEYMEMGSLYHLIHMSGQKKRLSWRRRLKMLCDICRGLMYIHRMKIAHRDLKSANCLVDKHWTVKICDFGLSRVLTTTPTRVASSAGTPEWMAPELIRNEPFTEKCDIFSLGVLMWELCTLNRPWEGVPSVQVVYAVANDGSRLEIPEGPLGKLIAECWAEPDERPSSKQVLSRLLDVEYTLC